MTKQIKGFCKYCGKEYTKSGMVKHLAACKERKTILENAKEKAAYYEMVIYGNYVKNYWLIIQIKDAATLKDLEQFIRDIWVEYCGQLSAFDINGQRYESAPVQDFFWGEPAKSMNCKLKNVFKPGKYLPKKKNFQFYHGIICLKYYAQNAGKILRPGLIRKDFIMICHIGVMSVLKKLKKENLTRTKRTRSMMLTRISC